MDKFNEFHRNSKRIFKNLLKREEKKDETLNLTSRIRVEERLILWNLENFNRCPLKTGEYHQSPYFCSGFSSNTKWALRIYPRGKSTLGKVGLYIHKLPSDAKIVVNFDFSFTAPGLESASKILAKKNIRMESEEYGSEIPPPTTDFMTNKSVTIICLLNVSYVDKADNFESCTQGKSLFTFFF